MIAICTPTRDSVHGGFAYDLVYLTKTSPDSIFVVSYGSIIPNLRNLLATMSVEKGMTHVLFIDSDMRFPPSTIHDLLKHDKDIVAANCVQRTQKEFTARKDNQFVSSKGKTGLEEVHTVGMGVTLIKAEVFKALAKPYFSMEWDGEKHIGEDVYFCQKARKAGFKIYIDHDLSQKIKHAGIVEAGVQSL